MLRGDSRAAGVLVLGGLVAGAFVLGLAAARSQDATPPAVARDGRAFRVTISKATVLRVLFLGPRSFRIQVLGAAPEKLPEYVVVKDDAALADVAVSAGASGGQAQLATSDLTVGLAAAGDSAVVSVKRGAKTVVERFELRPGAKRAEIALSAAEHVYGFGDKRAALDQRGQVLELLNHDAFDSADNDSYKSIPFYWTTRGYGLFFHNVFPSTFDVGAADERSIAVRATEGPLDFYFFAGDTPKEILGAYTEVTGRPAMLPRWAFGYHQGKASYSGHEAMAVARTMRQKKLPLDAIYYDDVSDASTDAAFVKSVADEHQVRLTYGYGNPFLTVGGEGALAGSPALIAALKAKKHLLVEKDGAPVVEASEELDGETVVHPDFFSGEAVDALFAAKWKPILDRGGILGMVDFGEFDHLPKQAERTWPSNGLSVAQSRTLFALVYGRALVAKTQAITGGRPTGMVRCGFAGSQRLGWTTTCDSMPSYESWKRHVRALLNLTLSGYSNVGYDIGGWNAKSADRLYARWFAAGTFNPFMWAHGQGDHEPYAHGAAVEAVARKFLDLRYQLVPLLYSLHEAASTTGVPVIRPFAIEEPLDPRSAKLDDELFLGDDLIVAPCFDDAGTRKLYLPAGRWHDFFDEEKVVAGPADIARKDVPLDRIPLYVRGGAVIPLGPPMQHTAEKAVDPLTVRFYAFAPDEVASGPRAGEYVLYEDDGTTLGYAKGAFQRTTLRFEQTGEKVVFSAKVASGDGKFRVAPDRSFRVEVHGLAGGTRRVPLPSYDGHDVAIALAPPPAPKTIGFTGALSGDGR